MTRTSADFDFKSSDKVVPSAAPLNIGRSARRNLEFLVAQISTSDNIHYVNLESEKPARRAI